jgi:hypothetical protein
MSSGNRARSRTDTTSVLVKINAGMRLKSVLQIPRLNDLFIRLYPNSDAVIFPIQHAFYGVPRPFQSV